MALRAEPGYPAWLGLAGTAFGVSFLAGACRNVLPQVQIVSDINNYLLPLWMITLGGAIVWFSRPVATR